MTRQSRATALHIDERPVSRAEYEALVTRVEALEARAPRRAGCLGARGAAGDCGGHRWASVMSDRSPDIGDVLRELRVIRKLLEPRVRPVTLSKTDDLRVAVAGDRCCVQRRGTVHLQGTRYASCSGPSRASGWVLGEAGRSATTRADRITIGGFRVERHGRARSNVALWRVVPSEPD